VEHRLTPSDDGTTITGRWFILDLDASWAAEGVDKDAL
jgi:hypothetical protein